MEEPDEQAPAPERVLSNSSSMQTFFTAADRSRSFDSQVRAPTPSCAKFPYEREIPRFFPSFPRRQKEIELRDKKGKYPSRDLQDDFHPTLQELEVQHTDILTESLGESRPFGGTKRRLSGRPASAFHKLRLEDGRRFSDSNFPEPGKEDPGFEPGPLQRPQTSPAGSWPFDVRSVTDKTKCGRVQGRSSTWAFEKSPLSTSPRISGSKSRSSSGHSQASSMAPLNFNAILYPSRNQWVISETAAQKLESFSATRLGQSGGTVAFNEGGTRNPVSAGLISPSGGAEMERTDSSSSSKFSGSQGGESSSSSSASSAAQLFRQTSLDAGDRIETDSMLMNNLHHTLSHGSTVMDWKGNTARQVEYAEIDRKRKSILGWVRRYIFCGMFGGPKPFWEEGDNDNSSVRRYRIAIREEFEDTSGPMNTEQNTRDEKAPATTQILRGPQS